MRHGETSHTAWHREWEAEQRARGFDYAALTKQERVEHEKRFQEIALNAQAIDDQLMADGAALCAERLQEIIDVKLHSKVFVSPFHRKIVSACKLLKDHPRKSELRLVIP